MKRQFPVTIGVFVAGFSALGCGVSDSEIPNRAWWTGDASVTSDASDGTGSNTDASVAANGGGKAYGNDSSVAPGEGSGGEGGSAAVDPGTGGAGGEDTSAAGSGEEAGGAGGMLVAGAGGSGDVPMGGTGGSAGPTCPTHYTMATHIEMKVSWPASKVSGLTIVNAGTGTVHVWTKSVFDENGNVAAVVSNSCGSTLPPIQTTIYAGSEKYQPFVPDSVWEQPTMPKFNGTATKNGTAVSADPGVALVGLKMSDPTGAWPTVTNVMGVDHDGDSHPGIAGSSKTDSGYKAIPADLQRSKRTDRLDLATRATMTLSATVDGCPETYTGTAKVTQFDNHVIGCHIQGGGECDTTQRNFVDSNSTQFTVSSATYTSTRVADDATCADIRAAVP